MLGNRRTLSPHLRQLILNPLQGHAQAARSIHNPDFLETLRELAAMDGAFVVNRHGIVHSAGTYADFAGVRPHHCRQRQEGEGCHVL